MPPSQVLFRHHPVSTCPLTPVPVYPFKNMARNGFMCKETYRDCEALTHVHKTETLTDEFYPASRIVRLSVIPSHHFDPQTPKRPA